ncbi:MAG: hypothetical protein JOZ47_02495 [Kutzneria sp.]|nr:hypothetical protein [Kutzneria sp.]
MGHPAVPDRDQNYANSSHAQLKADVDTNNDPAAAYREGDTWHRIAQSLRHSAADIDAAINRSAALWEGAAADAARTHLLGVRDWSNQSADDFARTGVAIHDQADAAAKAKRDMPDVVDFSPSKMIENALADPMALMTLPSAMHSQHERSTTAKQKAIEVVRARDMSLQAASSSIPALVPPPSLAVAAGQSRADTRVADAGLSAAGGHARTAVRPGGGGAHALGGIGDGTATAPDHRFGDETRTAGVATAAGYPSVARPPAADHVGSLPGLSGGGFSAGFGPAGYAAAGRSGGGVSPSDSRRNPGGHAGDDAVRPVGERAGAVGPGGASMATPATAGKADEDQLRKRPSYLVESDDVFGDGQLVAPTVIGEDLSDGY